MNKKNNLENKTTNVVEPKKEQKIQVVKKIIKKEKKKMYTKLEIN